MPARLRAVPAVAFLAALTTLTPACQGVRTISDPTLVLATSGGTELGVSTDYGIVFLGRTAKAGPIEVTAFFGDGPNIEKSVIEPVGGGLYTAETEIRLPTTELAFEDPSPGTTLYVSGHDASGGWTEPVVVAEDARVLGIVTSVPARLRGATTQIGAGVYLAPEGEAHARRLIGLVSGRVVLGTGAAAREYLTVVGPTDLWRLVAHRREEPAPKRWIYREDVR